MFSVFICVIATVVVWVMASSKVVKSAVNFSGTVAAGMVIWNTVRLIISGISMFTVFVARGATVLSVNAIIVLMFTVDFEVSIIAAIFLLALVTVGAPIEVICLVTAFEVCGFAYAIAKVSTVVVSLAAAAIGVVYTALVGIAALLEDIPVFSGVTASIASAACSWVGVGVAAIQNEAIIGMGTSLDTCVITSVLGVRTAVIVAMEWLHQSGKCFLNSIVVVSVTRYQRVKSTTYIISLALAVTVVEVG